MMASLYCCEASPWVCFHEGTHPDDHHQFPHTPRQYEFRQSMLRAHDEASCRFHPAYGANCLFHKKHPAVLQKHCMAEVFLPGNLSGRYSAVLFLCTLGSNDLFSRRLPGRFIIGGVRFVKNESWPSIDFKLSVCLPNL